MYYVIHSLNLEAFRLSGWSLQVEGRALGALHKIGRKCLKWLISRCGEWAALRKEYNIITQDDNIIMSGTRLVMNIVTYLTFGRALSTYLPVFPDVPPFLPPSLPLK